MDDRQPNCKGCGASVRVSEAEVKRMLGEMKLSDAQMVSEDVYHARLAICRSCDSLQYATTCRHCGCLVAFRAWLADKHCPDPGGGGW